jgi:hypothetical protein
MAMSQNVLSLLMNRRPVPQPRIRPRDYLDAVESEFVTAYLRNSASISDPPQYWYGEDSDEDHHIRLLHLDGDFGGEMPDIETRNAVARICLNAVQERLPQWGYVRSDDTVVLGRALKDRRKAALVLAPLHLFTLNWADSGPGFSWPESYRATFLPGFNRWVVTMSVDSPDVFGVTDLAIGSFPAGGDLVRSSGRVIVRYWRQFHCYDPDAGGWAYLFDTGLVDTETAFRWRARVWSNADRDGTRRGRSAVPDDVPQRC